MSHSLKKTVILSLRLSVSLLCGRTQESPCRPPPRPRPVPALHPAVLRVLILTAAPEGPAALALPAAPHRRPPVRVTPGIDGVAQLILSRL